MIKKLLFLLIIPAFLFAQNPINRKLFTNVDNDTIASITSEDSVYIQFTRDDASWQLLTSSLNDTAFVTADDKAAENVVQFSLASESYWTFASMMRFQIRSTGTDTITSRWISTASLNGALLLNIVPDTVGTNTDYDDSFLEGN